MSFEPSSVSFASPREIELSPLTSQPSGQPLLPARLAPFSNIQATVKVVAGQASASVGELLGLKDGAVLALDRSIDAPFDIVLDGVVLARGQLVAVGENFGIRVSEVCMQNRE